MVVKQKIGRKRYIAFELIAPRAIAKSEVIKLVRSELGKLTNDIKPWVVKYRKNKGLLRCTHTKKEAAIKLLTSIKKINQLELKIRALGTSGTIKRATRKYLKG